MAKKKIKDVVFGENRNDGKWYHCPYCGTGFDYMEVLNGDSANPIDTHERVYQCLKCEEYFRMPE